MIWKKLRRVHFLQLKPDAVLAGVPLPPRAKDDDDARGKADLLAILRRGAAAEAAEREKKRTPPKIKPPKAKSEKSEREEKEKSFHLV